MWFIIDRERMVCCMQNRGTGEDSPPPCRLSAGVMHSCCAWPVAKQGGAEGTGTAQPRGKLVGSTNHLSRTHGDLGFHHSSGEKLVWKCRGSSIIDYFCTHKLVSGSIPGHWMSVMCTTQTALAIHLARADQQSPKGSLAKVHELPWVRSLSQLTICLLTNTQFWRVREVHVRTYGIQSHPSWVQGQTSVLGMLNLVQPLALANPPSSVLH